MLHLGLSKQQSFILSTSNNYEPLHGSHALNHESLRIEVSLTIVEKSTNL